MLKPGELKTGDRVSNTLFGHGTVVEVGDYGQGCFVKWDKCFGTNWVRVEHLSLLKEDDTESTKEKK